MNPRGAGHIRPRRLSVNFVTNMASRLVKLVPAGEYFRLSGSERRLLVFALDLFGEPLSRFLLSGIGEETEAQLWLFSVSFDGGSGVPHGREIRVEPDDIPREPRVLPGRREPLVMLALLSLLLEAHGSLSTLSYSQEQVLNLLGWEDGETARSDIDQTVKRYARLSYSWSLSGEELTDKKLSFYNAESRFISGYGFYNAEEDGEDRRVANNAEFSSAFVEGLTRRTGFNVDWNRVSEITRDILG
jgi:hypothetical protein